MGVKWLVWTSGLTPIVGARCPDCGFISCVLKHNQPAGMSGTWDADQRAIEKKLKQWFLFCRLSTQMGSVSCVTRWNDCESLFRLLQYRCRNRECFRLDYLDYSVFNLKRWKCVEVENRKRENNICFDAHICVEEKLIYWKYVCTVGVYFTMAFTFLQLAHFDKFPFIKNLFLCSKWSTDHRCKSFPIHIYNQASSTSMYSPGHQYNCPFNKNCWCYTPTVKPTWIQQMSTT